mgnify:CR=1 FL=1
MRSESSQWLHPVCAHKVVTADNGGGNLGVNLCQHLEILVTAEQPLYKVLGRVCILCILKCSYTFRNPRNTVSRVYN